MTSLLDRLLAVPFDERDEWVDRTLGFEEAPPDEGLPPGGVPYLPVGVEEILAVVREAPLRPTDTLVDLGSGIGRVAILAHLLSGAGAFGVEVQAGLVKQARERCAALGLRAVSFVHANAADVELEGTVFFLYSPFNGETLQRVLRRLEAVARRHRIVVAAVDLEFPHERWLRPRASSCLSVALYDSRSG